ncbi:MAG: hypothetical protein KZQ97_03320 [Candidatus Thiodiazotropha sp. (ex Dulcina madagascariensis)]|nr:hypothetical protein [Candidatus Thiodiazotropha sp. (ex Dulcina madagascariensis)]
MKGNIIALNFQASFLLENSPHFSSRFHPEVCNLSGPPGEKWWLADKTIADIHIAR